jgi:alcohol dehydrogenase
MLTTRAAVLTTSSALRPYTASRPLEVRDVALEEPQAGELLVRIRAAGVCHSDLSVVNGDRPRPLPMVLGHEAAGEVVEVGSGVDDVRPGDHVVLTFAPRCGRCRQCLRGRPHLCDAAAASNSAGTLLGGSRRLRAGGGMVHHHLGVSAFSEFAVVHRSSVVVVEDDIPFDAAALMGCALLTGVGAVLRAAETAPGDTVAVWGLGGVGLSAVIGAVAAGAGTIIAIDTVPWKRDLALNLGATHALAPERDVRDVVEGGVDVAIEAVGGSAVLAAAYGATSRGGCTVTVSLPPPTAVLQLPQLSLVAEARTLKGSYLGSADPSEMIPLLAGWWRQGTLPVDRLMSSRIALDDVNEAMDALASGAVARQIIQPSPEATS